MLEAMTGTLFVGVMIARLVSLYSASGHSQRRPTTKARATRRESSVTIHRIALHRFRGERS